jgi:hypothetical protein
MSNPTSNFNWQMPTNTDLVSQLPADFEVFGQAVDTSLADLRGGTTGQILAKNTNADMDFVWQTAAPGDITGVTAGTGISGGGTSGDVTITNSMATAIDAKGDLVPGTGADTFSRLAVGANGTVLTADSAEATGLKWATPSGFSNFTLLNTGGTAMTGATSITVNVTTKETYMILFASVSAGASANFELRINGDTGNNYDSFGGYYSGSSPSATGSINDNRIQWARMGSVASESCRGGLYVKGGSTTAGKLVHSVVFSEGTAATLMSNYSVYKGSAAVTSFTFISSTGNFDAGTVYIFGGN